MSKLNNENCPFPVLIADGGSDHLEEELKSYSNVNYEYIRYPFDSSLDQFYKKMKNVSEKIKTPYTSMQDNDDYFDMEGMSRSVEILKNENYHSSRGSVIHNPGGDNMYDTYPNSIVGESAVDRVIDQSKHFHSNWHNVMHTNIVKICWSIIETLNPTNFRFVEQLNCYLPIVFGNGHRGDYSWMIHNAGNRIETETGCLQDHFPDQLTWINSSHWLENFNKMTEAVGAVISHVDKIPIDEALNEFTSAYPLKLPHLKEPLEERINQAKSLGYNKERISAMSEIISSYSI